ncbi:MAG: polysaccharide deacetylase family protein [Chitinispirillales bacterium]|jgi:peptidoglycan/xylan/chitin deacetylase (PgdA/CDA1 family)|nr:polysaccharide deacetylase family protein [Chitinispirillales bacterium]
MRKVTAFYVAVVAILFFIVIVLSGCNDNPANANPPDGGDSTGVAPPDSGIIPPDSAIAPPDTATVQPDTATTQPDTIIAPPDSAIIPPDTATVQPDTATVPPPPDTAAIPPKPAMSPKDSILDYIDKNWALFGYASKPGKYVALSFDDGPCQQTGNLLTALAEKKVKATFFLIGQNIRSNQTQAKAIYDAGHELANHSDGYSGLGGNTAANTISASLTAASAAIAGITGKEVKLFRAPNVDYGNNLTAVCTQLGLAIIGVSIWSNDYQSGISSAAIASNVANNAADGGIINCHEPNTAPNTVAAIPAMIDGLRQKGFWICTVSELAVIKGKALQAGVRYDSVQ